MRFKILRTLSAGCFGFADLKRQLNIDSSGHLQHHLSKLGDLIKTDESGKYCISDRGRDALLTMQPIEKYNEDARFREISGLLIRALRSKQTSIQDISIAQLSLFGPKVVPFLTSALSTALLDLKTAEESRVTSYYDEESKLDAPERAITSIVTVLGIISVSSTVPDIITTLPRTEAFEALAKIGNKPALDAVVSLIPAWFTKYVSADLDKYARENFYDEEKRESQLSKIEEVDSFLRKIFNSFDEEGRIALQESLIAEGFEGKNRIARVLAVVGDDKSIPALISALEEEENALKIEAAWALLRLKATETTAKIISEIFKLETFMSSRETDEYRRRSDEYYRARDTAKELANVALRLGKVEDFFNMSFHMAKIHFC